MKTYEFYNAEEREIVIALIREYFEEEKLNDLINLESFNIKVVATDDDELIDFCVFDPYHRIYKGYTNPSGCSNWELDAYPYLSDEQKLEWDNI